MANSVFSKTRVIETRPRAMGWKAQVIPPDDAWHESLRRWNDLRDDEFLHFFGGRMDRSATFSLMLEASASALRAHPLSEEGLRDEPKMGYDRTSHQAFFVFQDSEDGTMIVVSPRGLPDLDHVFG